VHVLVDIAVACGAMVVPLAVVDRSLAFRSLRSSRQHEQVADGLVRDDELVEREAERELSTSTYR
jgi:hypothetical protein